MNLDIIVAKLRKRGMSETNARDFTGKLYRVSNDIGIPISDLVDELNNFTLNELGDFLTNTLSVKGYKTGKVRRRTSSDIVARTIIK